MNFFSTLKAKYRNHRQAKRNARELKAFIKQHKLDDPEMQCELIDEYNRIQEKKSMLSARDRMAVENKMRFMIKYKIIEINLTN